MTSNPEKNWRCVERFFLNNEGLVGPAFVYATVEDTTGLVFKPNKDGKIHPHYLAPEIELRIGDCDRIISFDFSFASASERANCVAKLDVFIDALQEMRRAVKAELKLYEKRLKELDVIEEGY